MRYPFIFLSLLLMAGCKGKNLADPSSHWSSKRDALPASEKATKELLQGPGAQVVNGINQLGFNLLAPLLLQNPGNNLCISPTSIAIALGIARTGAKGATKLGIAHTYGGDRLQDAVLDDTSRELMGVLAGADPKVDVRVANSLWVASTISLKPAYVDRTLREFGASVAKVDFTSMAGVKEINDWVSNATAGHIPSMVDQASSQTLLMILNAIYFKAPWTTPFDKSATQNGDFHFADGSVHPVPMMHRSASFEYAKVANAQILSIPYASQRFAMLIYLPDEDAPLSDSIGVLQSGTWNELVQHMHPETVDLAMPKFKVSFKSSVRSALMALGMTDACVSGTANFSGISDAPLFVTEVLHRTTTEVNEEGTVATAATSISMGLTSTGVPPPPPIQFIADRPFLYAIRDTATGAIVFLGLLYDPQR